MVTIFFLSTASFAQDADTGDKLSSQFVSMNKEVSLVCALFLPGNIPGIANMMDLCGGRYAFKVAPAGMLEAQLLTGAGQAQKYYLGSFSYRGDMALNDLIISIYAGLDIHDAVSPQYDAFGNTTGSQSVWYGGVHAGGAIWWELNDSFYLRSDIELVINPGTSLLILFSAVYRFDGAGGGP